MREKDKMSGVVAEHDVVENVVAENVVSPCVAICALDENDICVGCHRSGDEITLWSQMSNDEKQRVMEKVREREQSSYI